MKGKVLGTYLGQQGLVDSVSVAFANCQIGGFVGDRHFGLTKGAGVREKQYPKGTEIFNYRQISAVSAEELSDIAQALNIEKILPEWVGANLLIQGIPDLTNLPPTTRLSFPSGATIVVHGGNEPCRHPGELIQSHYPKVADVAKYFVKASWERRGFVGYVERAGQINPGDEITVKMPTSRAYNSSQ